MPLNSTDLDAPVILGATANLLSADEMALEDGQPAIEPTCFHGTFVSCMEMFAPAAQVAAYLDNHTEWFPRCASPMKADPIGETGYGLTIGKFGSFGYEVEPKVGLDLLPQDAGIYRIQTIAVPGYEPPGYDVDFRAALQLVESDFDPQAYVLRRGECPTHLTQVEWELDLKVQVQFPRFIYALPKPLIQSTGDRLLNQIVRQVSRRLTQKVQDDFHSSRSLPFPKKRRS